MAIFVCPQCGGSGCLQVSGAVTVHISTVCNNCHGVGSINYKYLEEIEK